MVRHAYEQVEANIELLYALGQPLKEPLAIRIISEQLRLFALPIPYHPTGHMVDRSSVFNSQLSCHARNMPRLPISCKDIVYCEGLRHMKSGRL